MKPLNLFIGIIILSTLFFSCQKDPLDPSDFDKDVIKESYVNPKINTVILQRSDTEEILEVNKNGLLLSIEMTRRLDLNEGEVIVNNHNASDDKPAFLRKITSFKRAGNNVILETKEAKMTDAYSSFYIDSRNNKTEIQGRNDPIFSSIVSFDKEFFDGVGISLKGIIEPGIDFTYEFDTSSSYFTAEYDSTNMVIPKMRLEVNDLKATISGTTTFRGGVEGTAEAETPAIPILTIPETPIAIYAKGKISASLGLSGELQVELSKEFGPYNFSFDYDPNRSEPVMVDYNLKRENNSLSQDWEATGEGSCEVKMGVEVFASLHGLQENLAAGIFIHGYVAGTTSQKGTFSDPRPRLDLLAEFGVGANFSAKFDFFGDIEIPTPFGWFTLGAEAESPSYDFPLYLYSVFDVETCSPYSSALASPGAGSVSFQINTTDPSKNSFTLFVNGEEDTGGLFSYNTLYQVPFADLSQLVNQIKIVDKDDVGCILTENIINPSLVGTCNSTFTDTRDGNKYCTVDIGGQTWMAENLRYTDNGKLGLWYNDIQSPEDVIYGRLYLWSEIMNGEDPIVINPGQSSSGPIKTIQGICPDGWHIPSKTEFEELITTLGGPYVAGKELKYSSDILWPTANLPETTGFGAVPSGSYLIDIFSNEFFNRGESCSFWSNTKYGSESLLSNSVAILEVSNSNSIINANQATILKGNDVFSVDRIGNPCRCIKD